MKRYSPRSIGWLLADKTAPYVSTLVGIGAAKEASHGVLEAIVSGVKFPYDLMIRGSFAGQAGEAMLKIGSGVIEHPIETGSIIVGSYVFGKVASYIGERKRLKEIYAKRG